MMEDDDEEEEDDEEDVWWWCLVVMLMRTTIFSFSQWLNFKLSGITCLVGKIKFKLLSQGSIG